MSRRPSPPAIAAAIAALSVCLLAAALFNRYPLVTSDTGTYLHSSFTWRLPSDRPVFYGIFLGATHLGRTPWASIAAQAVLVATLMALLLRVLLPGRGLPTAVAVVAGLAATTSLPWLVGQLTPDVFAAVLVASLYLVAVDDAEDGRAARWFALGCLVFAVMVHSSHLLLAIGLAVGLQLAWRRAESRPGLRRVWRALAVAVAATLLGNVLLGGKLVLARGSHAFLMGRLIEDGIMGIVLDERCDTSAYRLCAFRDELPMTAEEYLWAPNNLLQRTGGWQGSQAESSRLIAAAVVTHPVRVAQGALASFLRQLVSFRTGDLEPPEPGSWVERVMAERFPAEVPRYRAARQHQGTLTLTGVATLHQWTAVAALVLLAVAALVGRTGTWTAFAAYVAAALVLNAAVTGALSGVHDRYQSRLIWLVVLAALVAVLSLGRSRKRIQSAAGSAVKSAIIDSTNASAASMPN